MNVHFSSKTDRWETPQDFFNQLHQQFNFTLDVCALPDNAKCERYFTPEIDGLAQDWAKNKEDVIWLNPPYGRQISKWLKKAYETSLQGLTIVCLVPARTDTVWWHDYAMHGDIYFVKGRLKFGGHQNAAPFPSAVIVFNGNKISNINKLASLN